MSSGNEPSENFTQYSRKTKEPEPSGILQRSGCSFDCKNNSRRIVVNVLSYGYFESLYLVCANGPTNVVFHPKISLKVHYATKTSALLPLSRRFLDNQTNYFLHLMIRSTQIESSTFLRCLSED